MALTVLRHLFDCSRRKKGALSAFCSDTKLQRSYPRLLVQRKQRAQDRTRLVISKQGRLVQTLQCPPVPVRRPDPAGPQLNRKTTTRPFASPFVIKQTQNIQSPSTPTRSPLPNPPRSLRSPSIFHLPTAPPFPHSPPLPLRSPPPLTMGKQPRGPVATLTHLPHDVLLHILDLMTPAQIAAYSQLCRLTAASATDPSIWASVARRHLGIAPPHSNTLSAKEVSRLATSLVSRWWLLIGAFVPGVAVHFRKGFAEIRARGGIELPISNDAQESAYVIGGSHKDAAVPVAVPGVSMDFFLDAAGPFPMDGMRIRIVHASEPVDPQELPPTAADSAPSMASLNLGPAHVMSERATSHITTPLTDEARVRIKVNNTTVVESCTPEALEFSVLDISVGPELLQTKPRMNTIVIEYDRSSAAAYWLKEVTVVPHILPMPAVPKESLRFGARGLALPETLEKPVTPEPAQQPRSDRPQEGFEIPHPRRTVRHHLPQSTKYRLVEAQVGGRHHKGYRLSKQAKKPKHIFHHNHYRSPRGPTPGSPRSRSGR